MLLKISLKRQSSINSCPGNSLQKREQFWPLSPCFSAFSIHFRTKVQATSHFSLSDLVACKSEERNSRDAGLALLPLAFSSAVSTDAGTCSIISPLPLVLSFLGHCFEFLPSHLQQLSCWLSRYVKTQKWLRKHLNLCYLGKRLILEANATYTMECLRFLARRGDVCLILWGWKECTMLCYIPLTFCFYYISILLSIFIGRENVKGNSWKRLQLSNKLLISLKQLKH